MASTLDETGSGAEARSPRPASNGAQAIARPHLDAIIAKALKLGPARVAVAYPCNASAIEAIVTAQRKGLAEPILAGPRHRIESLAEKDQFDVRDMAFVETGDDPVSA